jgi:hypothetical protein
VRGKTDLRWSSGNPETAEIDETDMLFVDQWHTADQVMTGLPRLAAKVSRWIVMHDTQVYGEKGVEGQPGLLVGLRQFMRQHPEWSVIYHSTVNNGLSVLSRDPRDKPKLPNVWEMAANFAGAVAGHVKDGFDKVDGETLQSRLSICTLCDQRNVDRCAACGCYCQLKASWKSQECPLGKWPALDAKRETVAA